MNDNALIAAGVWHDMKSASLATLEPGGMPHGSLVTVAPSGTGSAILLLSKLARHTRNLLNDDRCSLLIAASEEGLDDVLAGIRITVHGSASPVDVSLIEKCRTLFLTHHPAASRYIEFTDFNLYEFQPGDVFLVGGFGRIETLSSQISG